MALECSNDDWFVSNFDLVEAISLKGNFTETPNKFLGFPKEWTVAGTNF